MTRDQVRTLPPHSVVVLRDGREGELIGYYEDESGSVVVEINRAETLVLPCAQVAISLTKQ